MGEGVFPLSDAEFPEVLKAHPHLVVDCWAPWCGPCRMLSPLVEQIAGELAGKVSFAKLNTDENPRTASSLGIRSIPTLLFFLDGQLVDRLVGAHPRGNIEAVLRKHYGLA